MKKYVLLFLFVFLFLTAKAQDLIIGSNNDTIPLSQVKDHFIAGQAKKSEGKTLLLKNSYCVGLKVGYSTMPLYLIFYGLTLPDYYQKLKAGVQLNASAYYRVKESIGLGVEYSFFRTTASGNMPNETNTSSLFLMGTEAYRQYVNYLGPSIFLKQNLDASRRFSIGESFSAGLAFFRMEYQSTYPGITESTYADRSTNVLFTGNALGGKLGLTAEYKLDRSLSVGLGCDYLWCLLKHATIETRRSNSAYNSTNDGNLASPMDLSRFDYSFVVHYYF